jgi:hypothetical protein
MDHRLLAHGTHMYECLSLPEKECSYVAKLLTFSLLSYALEYNAKYVDASIYQLLMQTVHGLKLQLLFLLSIEGPARVVEMSHVLLMELTLPGWYDLIN